MKTLFAALVLLAGLAFVLAGCSDNATPLVSPNDPAVVSSATILPSLAKGGATVGSATGGGAIVTAPYTTPGFSSVKFAFSALKYDGEKYGGQIEMELVGLEDPGIPKKIHGVVKGVKFYGNVAMCWAELRTDFYADDLPGAIWKQIFIVTDNGEGKNSEPDRMSNPAFTTEALFPGEFDDLWAMNPEEYLEFIHNAFGTPGDYPLTPGNIQVREEK